MNLKKELALICQIKKNVIKLKSENLKKYKTEFYQKPYKFWQLDLLWEYIWGDISLSEIKKIFRIND